MPKIIRRLFLLSTIDELRREQEWRKAAASEFNERLSTVEQLITALKDSIR